jgi:hypothetical protein
MAILQDQTMTQDDMIELMLLREENARLKATKANGFAMKIGEKGALSVYGFGRWPVTLYKAQWLKLFERVEAIKAYMVANDSLLKVKD